MPIKPLTITDPGSFLITTESGPAADTLADTASVVTDKFVRNKPKKNRPGHPVKKIAPKYLHPQGLARLLGRLDLDQDEPEETVNIASATGQLEDLVFTTPKALPAQAAVNQKIRFGLYDRISQTIAIESSGGRDSRISVFEYVYGHLDFEITIDARGRLTIDPEKIALPFGIFARLSHTEFGLSMSGGSYKFYDLAVVILSNGWIRVHSKLTGQKVHYVVVKSGDRLHLRRYIGPTPDGLEIVRTIEASEPCEKTFTVNPENRIVEPSDRRFAPRSTMRITQIAPLPNPPSAPAVTAVVIPPLSVSMDIFYDSLRHTAQFETLIASLQRFQAAEPTTPPAPIAVPTIKTPSLDGFSNLSPEDQRAIIDILDNLPHDLFGGLFGGRRRRRKKTIHTPA